MLPKLYIDLNAVAYNYQLCKDFAPSARVAAVVKDNAYGLGAKEVARKLYKDKKCNCFFVAYADEGAQIRPVAQDADIYLLNGFDAQNADTIKQFNLTPVLSSLEQYKKWEESGIMEIKPALQVESGLHRLGVSYEEAAGIPDKQKNDFKLILSHLACADEENSPFNEQQRKAFFQFKSLFPRTLFSLSASDGMGLGADFHFDVVRAGAFLYGLKTCPALANQQKQVVTAEVSVLQSKTLEPGDSVGYNQTFTAKRPTRILALSVGYGDGLLRTLSNKGSVFFKYRYNWLKAPIIGRVSMDIILCDITDLPQEIETASSAFLLNDVYTFDDMGHDAGTIGYEVLSLICNSKRWEKEYEG
ncbi:MAG: alanine racemase [Alphaproteobacteria bacterium]|nr:alanine racemase [Alphaproteobacteria bacterium]